MPRRQVMCNKCCVVFSTRSNGRRSCTKCVPVKSQAPRVKRGFFKMTAMGDALRKVKA